MSGQSCGDVSNPSIRASYSPSEYRALLEIWRSAVTATHDFLSETDRDEITSKLETDYFPAVSLCVAEIDGQPVGFSGVSERNLEMLFIDADQRGGGIGTALLHHAIKEHGITTVDVNEQNHQALGFYTHHGFSVVGRSDTDEAGRPYPLLHLELSSHHGT